MQSWQYFLVQFCNVTCQLTSASCFCSGVILLSRKKFGSKGHCVYESTKEAWSNSGAKSLDTPVQQQWMLVGDYEASESTARAGQDVKRSTDFPASFDVEEKGLVGTQTSTLMVIFLFLASGTYDESLLAS